MKMNLGGVDKMLRIVIGVLLVVSALTGYFIPWGWIGVVLFLTGLFGWCPAYALLGLKTCPHSKADESERRIK